MQRLSSRKVSWPKFFATKLRLRPAAAVTVVFLLIFVNAFLRLMDHVVRLPPHPAENFSRVRKYSQLS